MSNLETASLLKLLRNNNNYTIQKVATILGVSKAAVSKWENGDDIATEHLYDLAKLYNVSFSELYYGKLDCEDNSDYWRRNYDLSNFELNEDITSKNVDNLKNLFEHIIMVKTRFYKLLSKWAYNNLSVTEIEEFKFIKQYFKFDYGYHANSRPVQKHIRTGLIEDDEKYFVYEVLEKIKDYDKEAYQWELSKIYDFNYDFKADEICKSGNLKAVEYMLESLSQIEKDHFLYGNMHIMEEKEIESAFGGKTKQKNERDKTDEEIENTAYFKLMLNAGANCFHRKKRFSYWDEEMMEKIQGKVIEEDNSLYLKYSFYDFSGRECIPVLENWKKFSYEEYLSFVDKKETNRLKDLVNIKDSNPLMYYENLVNRNNL